MKDSPLILNSVLRNSESPPLNDLNGTILVVDDNPHKIAMIEDYLQLNGLKVLVSRDGESGLNRAIYAKPDLILLDVMMPDITGYEMCRHLKGNPQTKEIPVIFMTVLSEPADVVRCFQEGGVDYIRKPVNMEEAFVRIQTQLTILNTRHHLQQQNRMLQEEIKRRKRAEAILEKHKSALEKRVVHRTRRLDNEVKEHHLTYDKLRQKEMQYRTLFENANEAILVVQDHICCFFNPKAADLFLKKGGGFERSTL